MSLLAIGLNHRSAPVGVLERATFTSDERVKALHALVEGEHVESAVLLSTCNRVEVYVDAATFHGGVVEVSELLSRTSGVPFETLREHLYVHHEARALQHLFAVACGLDSVVVGEAQVLGQLRESFVLAQSEGVVGRPLGDVLRTALRIGKRARTETGIDRAGASIVTVAVEEAQRVLGPLHGRRALIVGAGATGSLAGAVLRRAGVGEVVVANRTAARAANLAATLTGQGIGLADLPTALAGCDVVVCSTAATGVVLEHSLVAQAVADRHGRPLVILDLALPHDVDPAVRELPGVTLVDLDALAAVAGTAKVAADVEEVRAIIAEEVRAFGATQRAVAVAPTVVALRAHAQGVVREELDRLDGRLPDLDERTRTEVAQAVHRVVDKLLHAPTVRVKELAGNPGGDSYATALRELFDLPLEAATAVSATADGAVP